MDKTYLYAKDPYFINKREKLGLNHYFDLEAFI